LGKTGRKRTHSAPQLERRSGLREPPRDESSAEAVSFIAETAAKLGRLAQHHKLDLLSYLLAMVEMEAEEHIKLLKRRKLS
jgi:hypothetical protein